MFVAYRIVYHYYITSLCYYYVHIIILYVIMLAKFSVLQKPVTAHDSATRVMWLSQDVLDGTVHTLLSPYMAKVVNHLCMLPTPPVRWVAQCCWSLCESKTSVLGLSPLYVQCEISKCDVPFYLLSKTIKLKSSHNSCFLLYVILCWWC
mgnify:CR=1 FL=1